MIPIFLLTTTVLVAVVDLVVFVIVDVCTGAVGADSFGVQLMKSKLANRKKYFIGYLL